MLTAILAALAASPAPTPGVQQGAKVYTYVGSLGDDHVLLAWGTVAGRNTIGRDSERLGKARVQFGDRTEEPVRNWVRIGRLRENTAYPYRVWIDGRLVAEGTVRTWPKRSDRLTFAVIGDYGTGGSGQRRIARELARVVKERAGTANPVRFVLTTGDNIYGDWRVRSFWRLRDTGAEDRDWGPKFFEPYEEVLRSAPFYPTLGNHDGNMTEARNDLKVYLDNFFFPPDGKPHRWYAFTYGELAEFFALDTTSSAENGSPRRTYGPGTEQDEWLERELGNSEARWKIPYFHHPPFNAGPVHGAIAKDLEHWMGLFSKAGVKAVFNGHEHNFQFTGAGPDTAGVRYVISGAGGALRRGKVLSSMSDAKIEGWAPQRHFLLVEIERDRMKITPIGYEKIAVRGPNGEPVGLPLQVALKGGRDAAAPVD